MNKKILTLSPLGHTWLLDLDGTILKHNGYKIDGFDSFLPGAKEFLGNLPENDVVIFLTSRTDEQMIATEKFLKTNGIRYSQIIGNLPYGERILINDDKPSGLQTCHAVNLIRDEGPLITIIEDLSL